MSKVPVYLNRHVFVMQSRRGLFALPLSAFVRLYSVIVALPGHLIYYYVLRRVNK